MLRFALHACHIAHVSNVSESESILYKVLLTRIKLLHKPIIYHIPEHEKMIVVVAQAPKIRHQPKLRAHKKL
jgi:hypothetical protein